MDSNLSSNSPTTPPSNFSVGPGAGGGFVERRSSKPNASPYVERRQFGSSHSGLSPAGIELATAIDEYKVTHHRRYLTCDEMLKVLADLGYQKGDAE